MPKLGSTALEESVLLRHPGVSTSYYGTHSQRLIRSTSGIAVFRCHRIWDHAHSQTYAIRVSAPPIIPSVLPNIPWPLYTSNVSQPITTPNSIITIHNITPFWHQAVMVPLVNDDPCPLLRPPKIVRLDQLKNSREWYFNKSWSIRMTIGATKTISVKLLSA